MITKTFTQTYPNEPWNPSISDGNTVEVTWSGIRYHIFSIDANGYFFAIEADGDNKDEIDEELTKQVHEGHTFHILDAAKHPHVAALLCGDDTIPAKDATGGIPDYKFETPGDDEDYVFEYRTTSFLQSIYNGHGELKYDVASDTFTMPGFWEHHVNKNDIFDAYEAEAGRIDKVLEDRGDDFSAAQKTELQAQSAWLKTVRSNYANIDAWKIPHKEISFTWA